MKNMAERGEIVVKKWVFRGKKPLFLAFHTFRFVYFQEQNLYFAPFCLSSLVADSYFFNSNYLLLDPKIPLFNGHFAHFEPFFRWFEKVLPISLQCIFMLFALRLAAFCLAFSTKTHCV